MTITLELRPEIEERLRVNAEHAGLPLEGYLLRWIEQTPADPLQAGTSAAVPADLPPKTLSELFAQWQAEDATTDPEELRRAVEELEELKANLNANRAATGEEPLFL